MRVSAAECSRGQGVVVEDMMECRLNGVSFLQKERKLILDGGQAWVGIWK